MRRTTIVLLATLVCVLGGTWFFTNFERVSYKEYVGWRGEARFNRFFAAELLLRELGIDAESQASLKPSHWLPDTSDTLVTTLSAPLVIGDERDRLEGWLQNGGHLVLMPPAEITLQMESFLADLGFEVFEPERDEDADHAEDDVADAVGADGHDYELYLESTWHRIRNLDDVEEIATIADDEGLVVARRLVSEGIVTLVATDMYFMNWYLDKADHGRLLVDIVDGYYDPGKVWFVYGADFAPLWAVIWQWAPALVLSAAALFLLWLWRIMPRFGPQTRFELQPRRSIAEHMAAAGRFMWKQRGAAHLHQASVRALLHAAERTAVGIGRKSPQEQAVAIAHITGLDADDVLAAMHGGSAVSHREFLHQIQMLQSLRKKL